jgi:hypothetical protein
VGRTAIGRRELKPCILSVWVACKFTCTVLHCYAVAWKIWGETERERERQRAKPVMKTLWCNMIWEWDMISKRKYRDSVERDNRKGNGKKKDTAYKRQRCNAHEFLSLHTAPLISIASSSLFASSQADMPFVPQHPLLTRFLVKLSQVSWVRVLLLWVVLQLGDVNWNPAYWAYESHVNLHAPSCICVQWLGRSEERQKETETETESETGHENIVM